MAQSARMVGEEVSVSAEVCTGHGVEQGPAR
jgi:hypothetical protein